MLVVIAALVVLCAGLGAVGLCYVFRGRWQSWGLLPLVLGLVVALGAAASWALEPLSLQLSGVRLGALALLGAAIGAGLGLGIGAHWNMRRSLPLAGLLSALALEGAGLVWLMFDGSAHAAGGAPWVLLGGGLALAMVVLRQGVTPALARWSAAQQGAVALCAVLSAGLWWRYLEAQALAPHDPLSADLWGNASAQGAAAVLWIALLAAVALLGVGARVWVRRFGVLVVLVGVLAAPVLVLSMRWALASNCGDHLPRESFSDGLDGESQIPQGWCRADMGASLRCPQVPTRYELQSRSWTAQRLERDPMDTLWGETWSRARGPATDAHRSSNQPHFGRWMVVEGGREPERISPALADYLVELDRCGIALKGPVEPLLLEAKIGQDGQVLMAALSSQALETPTPAQREARVCAEGVLVGMLFPVAPCPGIQSLVVPLYLGAEPDQ